MTEDLEREVTKLEKFLLKNKDAEFVKDLRGLTVSELENRIKAQALYKQETITAKQEDQKLSDLKSQVKELQAPYNESIRLNDKISRFISLLIKDME